jgi:beta-lactamase superfamily II metal-dependent hydrolase
MAYEIDFLPVGDGGSGDAIAMRFWDVGANPPQQTVVVIDGGTKESGAALVEHLGIHYKTTTVNGAICTHSDADHASGLIEVLENCKVERLLMHLPWTHFADLDKFLTEETITTDKLKQHFKKSLDGARALEALARKKRIQIYEPFSDTVASNDSFSILGPSKKFYEDLLQSFRCVPESFAKPPELVRKAVEAVTEAIAKWVEEKWHIETLADPKENDCSAENNSSVILLFKDGNEKFLFTSDAGVPALTEAVNFAASKGIDLKTVNALQVPHHGSKHNVGPTILDQILGPRTLQPQPTKSAIVSASKGGEPKHPSRRVVNAFMRRQSRVFPTQGRTICHYGNGAPIRKGWSPLTPLNFFNEVEE